MLRRRKVQDEDELRRVLLQLQVAEFLYETRLIPKAAYTLQACPDAGGGLQQPPLGPLLGYGHDLLAARGTGGAGPVGIRPGLATAPRAAAVVGIEEPHPRETTAMYPTSRTSPLQSSF
jgi:hypothetical protein